MTKRKSVQEHLDMVIKELHWGRMQESWKDKSLAEAVMLLVRARAILAEKGGKKHVHES